MNYKGLAGMSALFLCAIIVLGAAYNWDSYVGDDGRYEYDCGLSKGQPGRPETAETIVGTLGSAAFPVQPGFYIPQRYIQKETLTIEPINNSKAVSPLLYGDGRVEVIPVDSGGRTLMGGVTFDELLDAYRLGLTVELKGHRFTLLRNNTAYRCFFVESARVLEPERAPLVVYHTAMSSGSTNPEIWFTGDRRVQMPQSFHVGRNTTDAAWTDKEHVFSVSLNSGDCIGYSFNASEPILFGHYAPNCTGTQGGRWGSMLTNCTMEGHTTNYMATTKGEHNFVFTGIDDTLVDVDFDIVKQERGDFELVFEIWGSHSSAFGGMGSRAKYMGEIPDYYVLGRTWSQSGAWTDHSYKIKTYLSTGTDIIYEFNATDVVVFRFSGPYSEIQETKETYCSQTFKAPINGTYVFEFSVEKPKTAILSFRCRAVATAQPLTPKDGCGVFYGKIEPAQTELRYSFPPRVSEIVNLTGLLDQSLFPPSSSPVMILEQIGKDPLFLHIGPSMKMIQVPAEGYTRLGNVTLYEVNDAYLNNLTVEVHGFPFTLTKNGTRHTVFHVNAVNILQATGLPLYAVQTMDVVSGRYQELLGGDEREYFPVKFRLGVDEYEGYYGNIERFYHVCLNKGDSISFTFNASGPVEFGLYGNRWEDHYGTKGFSHGDPEDYIIRESKIESLEIDFTAPRRGYYSFAFKAYSGAKTRVSFDAWRTG